MRKELILDSWDRKEHYDFFNGFDDPYFGITVAAKCTQIYQTSKQLKFPFGLCVMHQILKCANNIECFRYRIENNKVWIYDEINIGPTVARPDHTFCFGFFNYHTHLQAFVEEAQKETERLQQTSGLQFTAKSIELNMIHYSAVPWLRFTDLKHPAHLGVSAGIPKISVGQFYTEGKDIMIPLSITAHHGLMDGYHLAQFISEFEK